MEKRIFQGTMLISTFKLLLPEMPLERFEQVVVHYFADYYGVWNGYKTDREGKTDYSARIQSIQRPPYRRENSVSLTIVTETVPPCISGMVYCALKKDDYFRIDLRQYPERVTLFLGTHEEDPTTVLKDAWVSVNGLQISYFIKDPDTTLLEFIDATITDFKTYSEIRLRFVE